MFFVADVLTRFTHVEEDASRSEQKQTSDLRLPTHMIDGIPRAVIAACNM